MQREPAFKVQSFLNDEAAVPVARAVKSKPSAMGNTYIYAQPRLKGPAGNFELSTINYTRIVPSDDNSGISDNVFFHKPTQMHYTLKNNSVPEFHFDDSQKTMTPIEFYELTRDLGEQFGLVKVKFPQDEVTKKMLKLTALSSEQFWFKTRQQFLHSFEDESTEVFNFYKQLYNFHRDVKKVPLTKVPYVDKRRLDLYKLRSCVKLRGGYEDVCSKKLWAQIGRELGYSGRIMSSLSTSLRSAYAKVLQEFDLYEKTTGEIKSVQDIEKPNSYIQHSQKRLKLNDAKSNDVFEFASSAVDPPRIRDILISKGFTTNFDYLTETKKGFVNLNAKEVPGYDFTFWRKGQEIYDKSIFETKSSSIFSIKQFYEKAQKNLEKLNSYVSSDFIEKLKSKDENVKLSDREFDNVFGELLLKRCEDYEIDFGSQIPFVIHDTNYLNNPLTSVKKNSWDVADIALSEASYLRYLELDEGNFSRSKLDIGMLFSTNGWSTNDGSLPMIDYNHVGSSKIWYAVPHSHKEKFEVAVEGENRTRSRDKLIAAEAVKNIFDQEFKDSELYSSFQDFSFVNPIKLRVHRKNNHPLIKDDFFKTSNINVLPNDLHFRPEFFQRHNINIKKVIQNPGEFIFKYPASYSSNVYSGFCVSQNTSFLPKSWLLDACEFDDCALKSSILPAINTSAVICDIIKRTDHTQLMKYIKPVHANLLNEELDNRAQINELVTVNHTIINKFDFISDLDLRSTGLSKVVITSGNDCVNISLNEFFEHWNKETSTLDFLKESEEKIQISLHLLLSNSELKHILDFVSSKSLLDSNYDKNERVQFAQSMNGLVAKYPRKIPLNEVILLTSRYNEEIIEQAGVAKILDETECLLSQLNTLHTEIVELGSQWQNIEYSEGLIVKELPLRNDDLLLKRILQIENQLEISEVLLPQSSKLDDYLQNIEQLKLKAIEALESKSLEKLKYVYETSFSIVLNSDIKKIVIKWITKLEWENVYKKYFAIDSLANSAFKSYSTSSLVSFFTTGCKVCDIESIDKLENLKSVIIKANTVSHFLKKHFKPKRQLTKISKTTLEKLLKTINEERLPIQIETINLLTDVINKIESLEKEFAPMKDLLNVASGYIDRAIECVQKEDLGAVDLFNNLDGTEIDSRKDLSSLHEFKILNKHIKASKNWLYELNKMSDSKIIETAKSINNALTLDNDILNNSEQQNDEQTLYCYCRQKDTGSTMVECEVCKEWFHTSCINKGNFEAPKDPKQVFVCVQCNSSGGSAIFKSEVCLSFEAIKKSIINGMKLKILPDRASLKCLIDVFVTALKFKKSLKTRLLVGDSVKQDVSANELRFYLKKLFGSKLCFDENLNDLLLERFKVLCPKNDEALKANGFLVVTGYQTNIIEQSLPAENLIATHTPASELQDTFQTIKAEDPTTQLQNEPVADKRIIPDMQLHENISYTQSLSSTINVQPVSNSRNEQFTAESNN